MSVGSSPRTSGATANAFFNKAQDPEIGRPKLQRNLGGGSIGGPVWKDRLSAAGCGNVLHVGFNGLTDSGRNGCPSSPDARGETLHSNAGSFLIPNRGFE